MRERYNYKESIAKVHALATKYKLQGQCCVSSFNHEILEELEYLNRLHQTNIDSIYLYNFYDYDELPAPEIYTSKGRGINISSTKLTPEVVANCHANGKLIGVWIDRSVMKEGPEFYELIFKMGVDFFCSDFPDIVYQAIKNHYGNPAAGYLTNN